jgi:hypothetical protein
MDATIQFNDKSCTMTIEISYKIKTFTASYLINHQVLPEKPETEQLFTFQVLPKGIFGRGSIAAQLSNPFPDL